MKNIKWNRLSLFKKRLNNKTGCDASSVMFNENFDQLFTKQQNDYIINNLSKFNVNDINCTSSPIVSNIVNKSQKRSSLTVQKFRKALCSKLKNIIQQNTPKRFNLNVNDSAKPATSSIMNNNVKLLNFNYYTQTPQTASTRQLRSSFYKAIECKRHIQTDLYENDYENSFYNFQIQQDTFLVNNNFVSTSTPIDKRVMNCVTTGSTFKIKQPSFEDDEEDEVVDEIEDDNDEIIDYGVNSQEESSCCEDAYNKQFNDDMDESTQVDLNEPPKLIESTFDSSSCSNMSNDLIILQHKFTTQQYDSNNATNKQQNSSNKRKEFRNLNEISWNSMVIQKFHENTNASFNDMPSWAVGNQLNLALVNQFYYNPSARTAFNANKFKQMLIN